MYQKHLLDLEWPYKILSTGNTLDSSSFFLNIAEYYLEDYDNIRNPKAQAGA